MTLPLALQAPTVLSIASDERVMLVTPSRTLIDRVIFTLGPPADLRNLTIAAIGGQALLRWDPAPDLDVQYGGWIMFRHSPDMNATVWPNTTSIAQAVTGDQTHVYVPLKPGTYFARVYDVDGRPSNGFACVSTRQASVLAFSPVDDVQEDPLFTGQKTNCSVVSGGLMLSGEDFDSIPNIDDEPSWDVSGGVAAEGVYKFAAGIDLGSLQRSRITSQSWSRRSTSTTTGMPRSARSTLGRTSTARSAHRSTRRCTAS